MEKLQRDFYGRSSVEVAPELIGKYLVHIIDGVELIGKIVETEAYKGPSDKAAHSYNNRRTERNEVMYGPPGFSYVYIIYGRNNCMNVITAEVDVPEGILIRALEPVSGLEEMSLRRYGKSYGELKKSEIMGLTSGPGKLCMALGITREHNGLDLLGDELYILNPDNKEDFEITSGPRINIGYAEEAVHFPWRFYVKGNPYVSKPNK